MIGRMEYPQTCCIKVELQIEYRVSCEGFRCKMCGSFERADFQKFIPTKLLNSSIAFVIDKLVKKINIKRTYK